MIKIWTGRRTIPLVPLAHIAKKEKEKTPSTCTPLRTVAAAGNTAAHTPIGRHTAGFTLSLSPPQPPPFPLSLSPDVAQSMATSTHYTRQARQCPSRAASPRQGGRSLVSRAARLHPTLPCCSFHKIHYAGRDPMVVGTAMPAAGVVCRAHDTNGHEGVLTRPYSRQSPSVQWWRQRVC
jgi:hypothetical protein